jgi:hypothetical protein
MVLGDCGEQVACAASIVDRLRAGQSERNSYGSGVARRAFSFADFLLSFLPATLALYYRFAENANARQRLEIGSHPTWAASRFLRGTLQEMSKRLGRVPGHVWGDVPVHAAIEVRSAARLFLGRCET